MTEEIKKLPDNHLEEAKKMVLGHKKKKSCNKCYDRGYIGINQENMLVPCSKCVNEEDLFKEWKEYVNNNEDLVELYGDSLDDKEEEKEEE